VLFASRFPVTFFRAETSNVRENKLGEKRETKTDGIKISAPTKNEVDQDVFHGSAATTYQFDERRRLGGRDYEKHLGLLQCQASAVVGLRFDSWSPHRGRREIGSLDDGSAARNGISASPQITMQSHKFTKTPNTCRREVEFIADYLSSCLDLQQQAAFETHLKACSDCVAFLQTYKKTVELTRGFLLSQAQLQRLPRRPRCMSNRKFQMTKESEI
jgi:hypothetical protein